MINGILTILNGSNVLTPKELCSYLQGLNIYMNGPRSLPHLSDIEQLLELFKNSKSIF